MGYQVSDFSLLRLNLIEKGLLKKIEQNQTYDTIIKLIKVEEEIRNFSTESMIDELYNLIPKIDDTTLRRMTLKIKRNLYNVDLNNFTDISKLESNVSKTFLEKYNSLQKLHLLKAGYYEEVECIYKSEMEEGDKFLIGMLDNNFFSSALVLSSPSFGEHVYSNKNYSDKVINTLSAYFTRATLKTSPFSYYTVLGMNYFNENLKSDNNKLVINKLNNNVQMNQGILSLIIEGIAENLELSDVFTYEINQGLILRNDDINFISYKNDISNGFYGKYEYLNKLKYHDVYKGIVEKEIGNLKEWVEILSDHFLDERKALQKLIVNKILKPVIPFCITDGKFLDNLIGIIDQKSSKIYKDLMKELTALKVIAENFKKKPGITRNNDIKQMSIITKNIFKIIDKKIPENLFNRPLLYEDIGIWNNVPDTGADTKELLNLALKEISNHIERNPIYDFIVSEFIKKYGVHGNCDDVHSFFIEIQNKLINSSTSYKGIQGEVSDIFPLLKPSILLQYQIASNDNILNQGKIVINQLNKGIVNIVSRFIPLFDEQKEKTNNMLIKELQNWLSNASDQGEFVQVNFSADWNNVQAIRSITKRRIVWPSDLSDKIESNNENSLKINQVRLVHDFKTNKLLYQDHYGQTIIPIYTGTIPMQLLSMQFQLFNMVVDPWLIKNNYDNRFIEFPKNLKTIRQNNRIEKNNIVYKRAEWILPKESIPELGNITKTEIFKTLLEWKTKNKLPEEFFITTRYKDDHINILMKKKPFYFSFKNSYTHQHLEAAIKDNDFEGLILSEVSPSIDDGLGTSEGEVHNAEYLTLTRIE